jgi:ABC-type uncharacterized transport system substrate-binding protein
MKIKNSAGDYSRIIILRVIIVIVVGGALFIFFRGGEEQLQSVPKETRAALSTTPPPKYKVLYIISYHMPWKWTDDQFNGFKHNLRDLDVEYKVFQMNTKENNTVEWKEKAGQEARNLIDTWQPDLVYINDDDAQEYITQYYVNQDIPFVFSGVNAQPADYRFVGSKNIAGVLEREHFVQTVGLLKKIAPDVKKIAVVFDDSPFWDDVRQRMKEAESQLPDIELISWDIILTFEEYKQKMKAYQTTADAIALIGIFNFKDENGDNVPYQEVLKWTVENSNLPDFTFWEDRISHGTLCTVTVSGHEQGLAAGNIARGILVENRTPASYPMEPTVKGEPVISLARANKLGISIDSEILLTAEVVEKFSWEEE